MQVLSQAIGITFWTRTQPKQWVREINKFIIWRGSIKILTTFLYFILWITWNMNWFVITKAEVLDKSSIILARGTSSPSSYSRNNKGINYLINNWIYLFKNTNCLFPFPVFKFIHQYSFMHANVLYIFCSVEVKYKSS